MEFSMNENSTSIGIKGRPNLFSKSKESVFRIHTAKFSLIFASLSNVFRKIIDAIVSLNIIHGIVR